MKSKVLLLVSSILISTATLAQKDELKTLKKIYGREKISDSDMELYKTTLVNGESLIAGSTEDDKVYFGFYKAMSPILELNLVMTKPENAKNPGSKSVIKNITIRKINESDMKEQFNLFSGATLFDPDNLKYLCQSQTNKKDNSPVISDEEFVFDTSKVSKCFAKKK